MCDRKRWSECVLISQSLFVSSELLSDPVARLALPARKASAKHFFQTCCQIRLVESAAEPWNTGVIFQTWYLMQEFV